MKYIFLVCCTFFIISVHGQTADELEIKNQLYQFQEAHNKRQLDSMMMMISDDYQELFLPDISYNASSIRQYYKSLIENPAYKTTIQYNVEDVEVFNNQAITDVEWYYLINPSKGSDTLYFSKNRGMIEWQKENDGWQMHKAFGGNIKEVNRLNDYSAKKAIQTQMLDWAGYFNDKELKGVMKLYDKRVKGISTFNGSYVTYSELLQKYQNIFNNDNILVSYELDGMEEISFSNDLAYTLAVWNYDVYNKSRDISNRAKYRDLTVWKQQPGGDWKIVSFVRKEIEK